MPKHKKQKTQHNPRTNTNTNGDLSYEEIWDDSALLRSWNDAVAEYEYYHSIHARGEDVDDVLRQAELAEAEADSAAVMHNQASTASSDGQMAQDADLDSGDEGEIDEDRNPVEGALAYVEAVGTHDSESHEISPGDQVQVSATATATVVGPAPPPSNSIGLATSTSSAPAPAPASASATDDATKPASAPAPIDPATGADQTLENIKMAYYWAGYYSGLYDGQRQAQAKASSQGS